MLNSVSPLTHLDLESGSECALAEVCALRMALYRLVNFPEI